MTPEQLAASLRQACGANLRSVVLYGSAAGGDYAGRRSDYNVLVVVERLDPAHMRCLGGVVDRWQRAGNPPPFLFTRDGLRGSADVFPVELLDMKAIHRVLEGEDVLSDLPVSRANLRHQIEFELRSRLIQLRRGYLASGGRPGPVARLMTGSLSSVLVLARAALRLFQDQAPARKLEALAELAGRLELDAGPYHQVQALKDGRVRLKKDQVETLFEAYLGAMDALADKVDRISNEESKQS